MPASRPWPPQPGGGLRHGGGLSLAGMLELPVSSLLGQRPGPATGMPTRHGATGPAVALRAGHGEFSARPLRPGHRRQSFPPDAPGLVTAHRYQTPGHPAHGTSFLQDLQQTFRPWRTLRPIDVRSPSRRAPTMPGYAGHPGRRLARAIRVAGPASWSTRMSTTRQGISASVSRCVWKQQDKRLAKLGGMLAEFLPPERYGPADADLPAAGLGSSYGPCREAVDRLETPGGGEGRGAAALRPTLAAAGRPSHSSARPPRRTICVEGNQTGQFATLLRETGILAQCEPLRRYDGMPFTGEEIAERVTP